MKRVCLVGGGHTHALAAAQLAKFLAGRAKITLVSPSKTTPYSGMIPGAIESIYDSKELSIDLERLAEKHSFEWVEDEGAGIDPLRRLVSTRSGRSLPYDVASLNIGGSMRKVLDEGESVRRVKPVPKFLEWLSWIDSYDGGDLDVCVVGGGAAGVEMACAIRQRILRKLGKFPFDCRIAVVEAGPSILAGYPPAIMKKVVRELAARGINTFVNCKVERYADGKVHSNTGEEISADKVVLSTPIEAPEVLAGTPLELNRGGFMTVNRFLQSTSHPDVFACGDACDVRGLNHPKAGVFAVRQAKVLAPNIAARCGYGRMRELPLRRKYLSIISLGARSAIACYGSWFWRGKSVWLLKNHLDRSFMSKVAA